MTIFADYKISIYAFLLYASKTLICKEKNNFVLHYLYKKKR